MSWFVTSQSVLVATPATSEWTKTHKPGDKVPVSGIYRCTACKREVSSNQNDPFPTQNHHQHKPQLGDIGWELNVKTNTDGS